MSPPNPSALAELLCSAGVRAVVLNACETYYQGRLLQQNGVPYVVTCRALLSDQAASEYSRGFYDFLFNCLSIVAHWFLAHLDIVLRRDYLELERMGFNCWVRPDW